MKLAPRLSMVALLIGGCALAGCSKEPPQGGNVTSNSQNRAQNQGDSASTAQLERAKALAKKTWAWMEANYNKAEQPENPLGHTWGPNCHPGMSCLLVLGALKAGVVDSADTRVRETVESVLGKQNPNGSWDFGQGFRAVYLTSAVIETLSWLRDHGAEQYRKGAFASTLVSANQKGMDYLKRSQIGAVGGPMPEAKKETDFTWGGWAYSEEELANPRNKDKPKANMSTTAFALDAAAAFGVQKGDPLWVAATTFLERSQNNGERESTTPITTKDGKKVEDPAADSPDHGGARYSPDSTMVPTLAGKSDGSVILPSYGTMTYALLRGYLHAGLKKDDPRVKLAYAWLKNNFTTSRVPGWVNTAEAPNLDQTGLFYQHLQMAKTMTLMAEDSFADPKRGTQVNWREELLVTLEKSQKPDGSFINDKGDRWEEGNVNVATGYIMNALGTIIAAAK